MEYLWMVAGGIAGWVLVEFVSAATKMPIPVLLNIGMLFVGGLAGYTLAV